MQMRKLIPPPRKARLEAVNLKSKLQSLEPVPPHDCHREAAAEEEEGEELEEVEDRVTIRNARSSPTWAPAGTSTILLYE